jgi:hypothetical protein
MMKEPEAGTEVFATDLVGDTTSPNYISNFPVDMYIRQYTTANSHFISARLTGAKRLITDSSSAETSDTNAVFDYNNGVRDETSPYEFQFLNMFKRAKGFFDVVAYTGNGTTGRTVNHSLSVAPEMIWVKCRNDTINWNVYHSTIGATKYTLLDTNGIPVTDSTRWNDTDPTDTNFTLGTKDDVNWSGNTYIAYLFASLAGVSKVGSYTGNGSSQNIACGFSAGARFVLIKRTDSTGDWYMWDTTRGIVAGNDPHLSLNTTAAQVSTDDSIDPQSAGFTVNQVSATNINVSSGEYIFLAIA